MFYLGQNVEAPLWKAERVPRCLGHWSRVGGQDTWSSRVMTLPGSLNASFLICNMYSHIAYPADLRVVVRRKR